MVSTIFEFFFGKIAVSTLLGFSIFGVAKGETEEKRREAQARKADAEADLAKVQTEKVKAEIAAVQTQAIKQTGGARLEDESSISSSALLFFMGLISAGGYVFYSIRNYSALNRNDGKNDIPRYASAI